MITIFEPRPVVQFLGVLSLIDTQSMFVSLDYLSVFGILYLEFNAWLAYLN